MEDDSKNITKDYEKNFKEAKTYIFISKMENNLSKYAISVKGKILNYLSEDIIYFTFNLNENTEINPFFSDILIDIEFIPNKKPYAKIRSDFALPSLYDNRNYFYCLTNEHEYIYDPENLDELETILKDITNSGIQNFLLCIKESLEMKTFIYFGEYEFRYSYNINDFLENYKLIKFYRINQILENGKEIEEKYIILTQLYILIFNPKIKDKTFADLIFLKKLRDISFNYKKHFNKKLNINTFILYIQDIRTPNGITYEMEFTLIDRSRPPVIIEEEEEEEYDLVENNEKPDNKEQKNNNKNEAKNDNKNITANNSHNNNNNSNNNNIIKKEEEDEWDKYYQFEEEIEKKQREINFGKYKLVIDSYRPFFNHRSNDDKKPQGIEFKNKIMDYEKMFQHCEKMYNYYQKMSDSKKYKKRMEYYIININFFCAELIRFFDLEKASFQFYFDKMKYYLNLNENNQ